MMEGTEVDLGREVLRWSAVVAEVAAISAQLDRLRHAALTTVAGGRAAASSSSRPSASEKAPPQERTTVVPTVEGTWNEASADTTAELAALYRALLPSLQRATSIEVPISTVTPSGSSSSTSSSTSSSSSPSSSSGALGAHDSRNGSGAASADEMSIHQDDHQEAPEDVETNRAVQPSRKRRRLDNSKIATTDKMGAASHVHDSPAGAKHDEMDITMEKDATKEDTPVEAKVVASDDGYDGSVEAENGVVDPSKTRHARKHEDEARKIEDEYIRIGEEELPIGMDEVGRKEEDVRETLDDDSPSEVKANDGKEDATVKIEYESTERKQGFDGTGLKLDEPKSIEGAKDKGSEDTKEQSDAQASAPHKTDHAGVVSRTTAANLALDEDLPVTKTPGPLCGAIRAPPEYIIPSGTAVAAKTAKASKTRPAEWLLATVVRHVPDKQKYEVVDADPEESEDNRKRYLLPRACVIPLPTSVPDIWSKATQFSKGTMVLAMFPNTTAFYPATVQVGPRRRKDRTYVLLFDDDEEDGQKCKRYVSPRFVVHYDR